jgi:rod shape-determining protein MreC
MNIYFSRKKDVWRYLIGLLVLAVLILSLNIIQKPLKTLFYFISSPFQKIFWQTGNRVFDFFDSFMRASQLKKEVGELQTKNQELFSRLVSLEELEKQNIEMRQALDVGLNKEFKLVFSQIISKDISQDFIIIDRGLEDGISTGMAVINSQEVLFGKVFEVYKNFSKIMLISHQDSVFDVKIQSNDLPPTPRSFSERGEVVGGPNAASIYGAIKGKGGLSIFLDLVPYSAQIKEGDTLITSSLEGKFPKNLLVGEIKKIEKNDTKSFQKAEVEPFFNIKETENLFVITKCW